MPLPLPNLADRSFKELKAEAERVVRANCPAWTDFTPGDPGTTLIEAFAFLTEVMLYRLNRVPEKVQVALLNLLGVAPRPPAAATVRLVFSRAEPGPAPLLVPRGTRVADKRAELRFVTLEDATIPADGTEASVLAVHAERVEGELLGLGSGRAGQSLRLRHVPLLRPNQQLPTLEIGVAAPAGPADGVPPLEAAGQRFQLWQEVESFLAARAEPRPFLVDRATGVVTFGGGGARDDPARLPPEGAEIRAWYWHGGGRAGNAGAGTLTVPEGAPSGIAVTNPLPATGGEDGETLEEAVARGREEVRTVGTAVTARDFETVARLPGGIARARARAAREQWVFGEPGVVQVGLVPEVRRPAGVGAVTPEKLAERQTPELLDRVARLLAERTPLGVRTAVGWVRCRPVGVSARVVVAPVEDPEAVEARLRARLDRLLAPDGSWPFDRPLRASDAYEALLAEPGVRYVEELAFRIESGPEARVDDVLRDPCQPGAWFAATATGLFRSLDAGRSWALLAGGLPEGAVRLVRADRDMPGLLAAVAPRGNKATAIHVSRDGGESWTQAELLEDEKVYDAAWLTREGRPTLFLATERALRRLDPAAGEGSAPVETAPRGEAAPDGFRAVATGRHPMGVHFVAVALREKKGGVLLSREGGEARSFERAGGEGRDLRRLGFQRDGNRAFLWAAVAAEAGAEGEGLLRTEARADGIDPGGWVVVGRGWKGGSCHGFDIAGGRVVAASYRHGVLTLPLGADGAAWSATPADCGLPRSPEAQPLDPVQAVAAAEGALVLAGTGSGLYAAADGTAYAPAGASLLREEAPLPPGWLYCSGPHALRVTREARQGGG